MHENRLLNVRGAVETAFLQYYPFLMQWLLNGVTYIYCNTCRAQIQQEAARLLFSFIRCAVREKHRLFWTQQISHLTPRVSFENDGCQVYQTLSKLKFWDERKFGRIGAYFQGRCETFCTSTCYGQPLTVKFLFTVLSILPQSIANKTIITLYFSGERTSFRRIPKHEMNYLCSHPVWMSFFKVSKFSSLPIHST